MKKATVFLFLSMGIFASHAQVKVDDFYRNADGKDWSKAIQRALNHLDSLGHGSLEFTGSRNYTVSNSIELPHNNSTNTRRILIFNGNGCNISASDTSVIVFRRIPKDLKEASGAMMSTRFSFNDFSISGGKKAICLSATYGSNINRCNFSGQSQNAVDLQFGLNTSIFQCNSTGSAKNHFLIRTGEDWGGNSNNSQSNQTVLDMCRVYSGKGTDCSFKVLGSSGCVLRDCIAEGGNDLNYSIYFDIQGSSTVRLFKVENLHLEQAAQKAGIYIHNSGIAILNGIFYQKARENFPLVYAAYRCDQISLLNVPHYVGGSILFQEGGNDGASWLLEDCSKEFYEAKNWHLKFGEEIREKLPYYFKGRGFGYHVDQEVKGGK